MDEIVVVGDIHEGRSYDIRVDLLTGVSARTFDLHRNLVRAAKYAIESRASVFVMLGDVFDRTNVAPIFREMIRQEVIVPLGEADIKVMVLAGNHDQPRVFQRGTSIDDFSGYSHVKIFRRPECIVESVAGRKICFVMMPFLYPDSILDQSGRALQDVPEDQRILVSQAILKEFLQNSSKIESDAHILLAHYYFEGAEVSNSQYPEAEMGELEFNPSMIPENLDLAVFGHIHLYQEREARGVPIVFVGAVERIDWGEREGPKGFLAVNPTTLKPTFHELPTRDMLAFYVKIDEEETDPTSKILETLPADVAEKMIRLTVEIPLGARPLIRESRIAEKLDPAFDRKVVWRTQTPERIGVVEAGMALADHYGLLESYIDVTFAKHPHKEALAEEGRNILREVLES